MELSAGCGSPSASGRLASPSSSSPRARPLNLLQSSASPGHSSPLAAAFYPSPSIASTASPHSSSPLRQAERLSSSAPSQLLLDPLLHPEAEVAKAADSAHSGLVTAAAEREERQHFAPAAAAAPALAAADPAAAAPSVPVVSPAAAVAAPAAAPLQFKQGENPLLSLNIPTGELGVEHVAALVSLFSPAASASSPASASLSPLLSQLVSHLSYRELFDFLISAPRSLSAATFRHFARPVLARHRPPQPRPSPNAQIGLLLLQFLHDHLASIAASSSGLTLDFIYPRGADSFTLDVPTPEMFVLVSSHPSDPLLVHPLNALRKADTELRRLVFGRQLRLLVERGRGLVALGSGDVCLRKLYISFSCDAHYERRQGALDLDGSGRQVVEDRDGKVVIRHGRYVPARYDDWIVLSVLNQQTRVGLPKLGH